MILIWVYRILLVWLGGGVMAFFAALLIDIWRNEEIGVAYVRLHCKGALLLVLAWPWAFGLVMFEYARAAKEN
jgi:hypothetical protein